MMMLSPKTMAKRIRRAVRNTLRDGGVTLDGATLRPYHGTGYAVGTGVGTITHRGAAYERLEETIVNTDAPYYGLFVEDDGLISIDTVQVVDTLDEALALAKECRQKSIYQFETGWVIDTPRDEEEE